MISLQEVEPRDSRLLATRYFRPEKAGKVYLNPAWLRDNNRQLWRLLKWSDKAGNILRKGGSEPESGLLLLTAPNQGVLDPTIDHELEVFWLWAEQIIAVISEEPLSTTEKTG